MKRIGIDARMMGKGYGIGRYVEQLVGGLLQNDSPEYEYIFFVQRNAVDELKTSVSIHGQKSNVIACDIPWYSWKEQMNMPQIIREARVDLMHFPHWNVPLAYHDPFVVTIHDLTMYHYPRPEATTLGPVKFWVKDWAHRLAVKHAVGQAQLVIATSEYTKQDIVATLGIEKEKIAVVYQAPFENLKEGALNPANACESADDANISNLELICKKYDIKKPYVLYVGAAYPHKNLERLIEAWGLFEETYSVDHQLVLVGKEDYFYRRLMSSIEYRVSSIKYIGSVSDDDLSALYQSASLFVFPSLYEGFGIPPLEAMVHNVPVISSNRACLPEVLGEAALYFDPESPSDISDKIQLGLKDMEIRSTLRQNAKHELQRYSFESFMRQTMNAYAMALEK